MSLKDVEYGGTVLLAGRHFYYKKATEWDIKEIADLYQEIAVTADNYREKFNPKSMASFGKTGGMFVIMKVAEIRSTMEDSHCFWAVIRDETGELAGCFWFADYNKDLEYMSAHVNGTVVYPREVIVSVKYKGYRICRFLYYSIFKAMQSAGYEYSICDVYETTAYLKEGHYCEARLLNRPSYVNLLLIGGRYGGTTSEKKIILPDLCVWIQTHVFLCCHKKTVEIYSNKKRGRIG